MIDSIALDWLVLANHRYHVAQYAKLGPGLILVELGDGPNPCPNVAYVDDGCSSHAARLVLKDCTNRESAKYEVDLAAWLLRTTDLRIPRVSHVRANCDAAIGCRHIAIEYIDGTSADHLLARNAEKMDAIYERIMRVLLRFQFQTAYALSKTRGLHPSKNVERKWLSRRRRIASDYETRLLESASDARCEILEALFEDLVLGHSLRPVCLCLQECTVRWISKDSNPRNWIIDDNGVALIDFSETAIDAGVRDLANLISYYKVPSARTFDDDFLWLEEFFSMYVSLYNETARRSKAGRLQLPDSSNLRAAFYAACIYTTLRRIPCQLSPWHNNLQGWINSIPLYSEYLERYIKAGAGLSRLGLRSLRSLSDTCAGLDAFDLEPAG